MAKLTTVPSFTFNQGDIFSGIDSVERPVRVAYYNGSISLEQDGEYETPETIILSTEHFKKLFQEIQRHYPEAEKWLKEKYK